jgi:phage FluMu protein Com
MPLNKFETVLHPYRMKYVNSELQVQTYKCFRCDAVLTGADGGPSVGEWPECPSCRRFNIYSDPLRRSEAIAITLKADDGTQNGS